MSNKIIKVAKFIKKMSTNNEHKGNKERAEGVVRNHVVWSMGAGLIPIPVADFIAVAAVQLDMIRTMAGVYGVDFRETEGKALITSLTGSGLSRLGANALIKLIPGVGSALGGVSMSIVSGASTYALGQVFKRHFEYGGTFVDFDTDRFQRYYDEQFEKGKTVAKEMKKEEKAAPVVPKEEKATEPTLSERIDGETLLRRLKELAELKEMKVLTEEEFTQMKVQLIKNYSA